MRFILKKLFTWCMVACLLYAGYLSTIGEKNLPPLKDGDIVFQSPWTADSLAIGFASAGIYIHTGIIKLTPSGPVVVEAAEVVKETPLHLWITGGMMGRFAVYRYKGGLTKEQSEKLLAAAKVYYGRPYDHYFSFDNNEIYCSELVYLAFKDAGIPAATPEKVGSLYLNNHFTKELIEQRWKEYPACKGKNITFDQCYDVMMQQEVITPQHIAEDSHFERIFTNYPR